MSQIVAVHGLRHVAVEAGSGDIVLVDIPKSLRSLTYSLTVRVLLNFGGLEMSASRAAEVDRCVRQWIIEKLDDVL